MLSLSTMKLISLALQEDFVGNDITTAAIFGKGGARKKAAFLAKQDLVLSGCEVARAVFRKLSPQIRWVQKKKDGNFVKKGEIFAHLEGPVGDILSGERVALNFLQRLSGVATLTQRFVSAVRPHQVQILDTRKTTPGFRVLEKQAVVHGGGFNHRMALNDMYLIKDNHIAACGGIGKAIRKSKAHRKNKKIPIEAEAKTLEEVREAVKEGVDILLLDNMSLSLIKQSVKLAKGECLLEVSGGVNLKTVGAYAKTGIDRISIGALTHSAMAVDISLEIPNE